MTPTRNGVSEGASARVCVAANRKSGRKIQKSFEIELFKEILRSTKIGLLSSKTFQNSKLARQHSRCSRECSEILTKYSRWCRAPAVIFAIFDNSASIARVQHTPALSLSVSE